MSKQTKNVPFKVNFGEPIKGPYPGETKILPVTVDTPEGNVVGEGHFIPPEAYQDNPGYPSQEAVRARAPFHSFEFPYKKKVFKCRGEKNGTEWEVLLEGIPQGRSASGKSFGEGKGATCEEAILNACKSYVKFLRKEQKLITQKINEWNL